MEMRWSLKELYPSFESEEFREDLNQLEVLMKKINHYLSNKLVDHNQAQEKMEDIIQLLQSYQNINSLLNSYANLVLSVDTKNHQALKVIEQLNEKRTLLTKSFVYLKKWLASLKDLNSLISLSNILQEHSFFLKEMAQESQYLLAENEEYLIAKMSLTGSKAWEKLQQLTTSTLLVEIEIDDQEKKLPLSVIRNYAYEKDASLRRKAYQAELAAYKKIEDSVAASLNGIKGEVISITERRGYKSPLKQTLIDSRLDEQALEAMLLAMQESLPDFWNYYRQKARLLGYDDSLPFYDLFAPVGCSNMRFTYQQARDFIVDNFRSFSDKLADYADNAFANNWIDAQPREGKVGGAFCANIQPIKESRILSNFTGSLSDVTTLAHELGHGYHGFCLNQESILNTNYPMPLAETASIMCETIVENAALKMADEDAAITILENSLSGAGQVIVDIYSRYLFETKLFQKRKESSLSVEELKGIMIEAQREAYGKGLDEGYLHPYMWICKPHYYSAGLNFYNFPYAFGLLFGKGLYAKYLSNGEDFISKYDQLLSVTGRMKIVDVAKLMDVDIRSIDFWRDSLSIIKVDIDRFIQLSQSF